MFLLTCIAAVVFLFLSIWFYFRVRGMSNFMEKLKASFTRAAKGEGMTPLEVEGNISAKEIIYRVNAIYASLEKYQPLVDENTLLKKEANELKAQLFSYKNAVDYLNIISDLGQKISSTLSLQEVISNLVKSLGSMMNTSNVEIQLNSSSDSINGFSNNQNDKMYATAFANWSLENGRDVFLEDVEKNYGNYLNKLPFDANDKIPQSLICCPMMEENKVIGVISAVSFQKKAFSSYHFNMIKSLLPYASLAIANARGYEELTIAQQQLVHQEKMASLGQLTAGVAHEINNPINFVSSNISPLKRDMNDVMMLLEKYAALDQNNFQSNFDEIKKLKEQIDLDYTLNEIRSLLNGIEEGSRRTAEIVKGLRNFSRLDEEDKKKADINEGLNSTLLLLQNKIKYQNIEMIKSLGDLPEIECYPGQLNQVFMNIITNSIDAVGENKKITITTSVVNEQIKISIRDTGHGMSEETKKKIFDPFFTTKDVGKGTGLGLSISYGIIEKHNGKIEVNSEPGKGTEFIILLPIL